VLASINQGVPLLKMEPKDPVSRALANWADELAPVLIKHEKGWFHSMLGGL